MQYREGAGGERLSLLGFGCMRFTRKGPGIDKEKAEKEILTAIKGGVNYFDTAYIYPGSEALLGEILEKNRCRDRVYIATKLPHYMIRSAAGIEKTFQEELKRLRTDHIDYYLMHMLNDVETWEKLRQYGIEEWIAEKKASGQICHIGFSYHGHSSAFQKLLDAYPWEFCQIQYNYMDENSQAGRAGLQYAHAKGIPVIIMEPLRGGRLVNLLPKAAKQYIEEHGDGRSAAEWAFRWLYDQPEVTVVLSGMNSRKMVKENIRIASETLPGTLTAEEHGKIRRIRKIIDRSVRVPCTGCAYCMPCPKNVDIPGTFRCYNEAFSEGKQSARREYLQTTVMRAQTSSASQCIRCGKCEQHCPQGIPVREKLAEASKLLETPIYRIAKKAVQIGHFY